MREEETKQEEENMISEIGQNTHDIKEEMHCIFY